MNATFCFMALVCLFRTGRNEVTRVRGKRHLSDNVFVRSCVRVLVALCLTLDRSRTQLLLIINPIDLTNNLNFYL